jgi:hypothetical protein
MLPSLIVAIFGVLIFLFIFWKRIREDYAPGIIFESAFYILLGIGISQLVSLRFFPNWFFWAGFLGSIAGLFAGYLRFKLRLYESLEGLIIGLLPWVSFVFLKDSVINSSLSSFLAFLATLLAIFIFYYIDTHFREFTWYKSGKVGFTGLSTLAIVFVVRSAIALFGISVLTFAGIYEAFVSGGVAFVCLILIYVLSKKIE